MKNDHLDILYVITKSNWGGAQRHVYDLAVAAKEKMSVGVALGGAGVLSLKLKAAGIQPNEIAALQRDISFGKEVRSLIDLFRLFRKLRPTTVHLHSPKAGGLGALAAQIAGVPRVIYTSHGLPFEEDRPLWQKAALVFFTWLTFILCDTVILITQANFHTVSKMPWLGHRIRLIRSGIDPVHTLPREEARRTLQERSSAGKIAPTAPWVGTIAEYHPVKGLEYLIQGIAVMRKQHPDVVCVLIGGGEQEARLRELIEECDLSQNVFLAGFVDAAARYLSAFDIFTLTSLKEGLPYAALEAGSVGLGFVGSSISSIQEIVTDMTSGILVRPKQPKEIAGALLLMIEDAARRESYGKALKERVEREFSKEEMLEKTLALYMDITPSSIRHASR